MRKHMNKELIGIKRTDDYSLYSSSFVIENRQAIVELADRAHNNFKFIFNDTDSTRAYSKYNLFSLTAKEPVYYVLYQQIVAAVRDRIGDDRPLWMQCWMNYHKQHEVLDWHNHDPHYLCHGYLSIEPRDTVTEFRNFTIENKIGNLYIGNAGLEHRVVVKEPYHGNRITMAFDVSGGKKYINTIPNLSFIPIP